MSKDNECKTCSGFLTGAILGAVLGVVFAPKKGAETRKDLREWVDKALEEGKEKMDDLPMGLGDKINKFGDTIKTHADKITQTMQEQKDKIANIKSEDVQEEQKEEQKEGKEKRERKTKKE
ncbi:MAG TPA: YtxH domain-containing protein [Elusimicrobiales bacterium]|nr:YtxH domain-containing protein [Elusimicrobiales bacterium]